MEGSKFLQSWSYLVEHFGNNIEKSMSFVLTKVDNHIATLTINRPDALNAMNDEVVADLESAVQSCIEDENVGVIELP